MSKKTVRSSTTTGAISSTDIPNSKSLPQLPAAELLSFLKQTRAAGTWTEKEFAKALKIGLPEAKSASAALQLQGYIEPAGQTGKWRITEEGDLVSGAKPPRFTRRSVEKALDELRDRIKAVNEDPNTHYNITHAVAFGDFLGGAARVQAAEVGIRLTHKKDEQLTVSAEARRAEIAFLKQLRGKSALLHIVPYEDWMSTRSRVRLL